MVLLLHEMLKMPNKCSDATSQDRRKRVAFPIATIEHMRLRQNDVKKLQKRHGDGWGEAGSFLAIPNHFHKKPRNRAAESHQDGLSLSSAREFRELLDAGKPMPSVRFDGIAHPKVSVSPSGKIVRRAPQVGTCACCSRLWLRRACAPCHSPSEAQKSLHPVCHVTPKK